MDFFFFLGSFGNPSDFFRHLDISRYMVGKQILDFYQAQKEEAANGNKVTGQMTSFFAKKAHMSDSMSGARWRSAEKRPSL